ncbi:hypothetical protein NQ314_007475 [Rhamnusium bicolor]|uniref:TTF-type domain-containing protein n=1 Tax=Rhamnusium bicolor TaxID=1586634 RepID=A0AAV8YM21_9CUCU|nr:hypothetical protein NQ314_007475 [Rhamnusium bicolor]
MRINSLNDLFDKPFKNFTKEEQLQIAKMGRFVDLKDLSQNDKGKCRSFSVSWYHRVKWLTGNTVNRKLYCWNCVLFPSGASRLWNTTGFDDLRNLSQATKKHEESKEHIYATVKLRLLCKNEKRGDAAKEEFEKNVQVKRNREYLERLIDISTALARLELPFRNEDDEDGSYKSLLNLFKKYDDIVRTQVEQNNQFRGLTKTIQIDLTKSIADVVRQRIVEEVAAANFFSLMVDEINCNPESKQISLAIRYVKNGKPIERFIGLHEVSYGTKSEEVVAILEKELEKFNFKEKLISQSYDGAVVKPTELYSLQQAVKRQQSLRQALFVHYYAHEFSSLLAQTLLSVQECRKNIKDILPPDLPPTWLESIPACIFTVKNNYESILKVLEFIINSEKFEHSMDIVSQAVNLISHLKSCQFLICLSVIGRIFLVIEQSFQSIKEKALDSKFHLKEINNLIGRLRTFKTDTEFNKLIADVVQKFNCSSVVLIKTFALTGVMVDNIIHEIEGRSLDVELADFFALVSVDKIPTTPGSDKTLESDLIASIKENYPKVFDLRKLVNEFDIIYSDPTVVGIGDCDIDRTSDILKFIYDNDIRSHLPEFYKLLELVVTVPSVAEPLEGPQCVLNRIKTYCESEKQEEPRSALAILSIEKELLCELEKSTHWYSHIIDYFATLPTTSSIELTYKNVDSLRPTKVEVITEPEITIKSEIEMD